jgi:hypothetical protein
MKAFRLLPLKPTLDQIADYLTNPRAEPVLIEVEPGLGPVEIRRLVRERRRRQYPENR